MALIIVVSCCSVPQLYKSGNKVRSTYVRRVAIAFIQVLYYSSYCVLGLPIVFANKFLYSLADPKSALASCSQLLVVTNNLNSAGCLA